MYYLEILDSHNNWSNEIGDYNNFEKVKDALEIIPDYEQECISNEAGYDEDEQRFIFDWRILDVDLCLVKRVTNIYDSKGEKLRYN